MDKLIKYIPGFRSGKKYKMVIAIIYYILSLFMVSIGVGYGLFYLAMPFLFFSFVDLIKNKRKSISIKRPLISLMVSFAVFILGMSISPTVDFTEAEGQKIEVNNNNVNEDDIQPVANPDGQDPTSNDSVNKESEEATDNVDDGDSTNDETDNKDSDELKDNGDGDSGSDQSDPNTEDGEINSIEVSQTPDNVPDKASDKFEVHFIDVGQGDASLIISGGETMLIDGGNPKDSSLIYAYLKKHGIEHIDYIVNTHPHADHVGGLAGALNYATVGKAFSSVTSYDTRAFNSYVKYLNEQNINIIVPKAGDNFKLGSASVHILSGSKNFNDPNNDSIVLKVTYGSTSFLFTGDSEREAEQALLDSGANLSSTVLHVGHHGSDTSTTYPFLREIMPEYGVISVGSKNTYGHPTDGVLSKLRDADVKVLRTDMQGDIIFTSNGSSLSFTTERNTNVDTLASVSKDKPTSAPTPKPSSTTQAKPTETTAPTKEPVTTESSAPETKTPETEVLKATSPPTVVEVPVGSKYILNTSSKKIHYPNCHSVKKMSEKNKKASDQSRDELISSGYDPCGNCNP